MSLLSLVTRAAGMGALIVGLAAPAFAQSPTRTRLITASPSAAGQPTPVVVEVDSLGGGAPRGEVSFADGAKNLGSAPLDPFGAGNATMAIGGEHACAVTSAGGVQCWGRNPYGQLGDGTLETRYAPVPVTGLASGVVAVAAGVSHSCALTETGAVQCWGLNSVGQLGDGATSNRPIPAPVSGLASGVVAIAAGGHHSCALTANGVIKCWGANDFGQLGIGTKDNSVTPRALNDPATVYAALAAGVNHTCGLTGAGGVKCWGGNAAGQLGDRTTRSSDVPVEAPALASGFVALTAGGAHTCAITSARALACWGENADGQLGDGSLTDRYEPTPIPGVSVVVAVAAGARHTCALVSSGGVRCWGFNGVGQLGDGSTTGRPTPAPVVDLGGFAVALASGDGSSCAQLSPSRIMRCWGANRFGQVGDGGVSGGRVPASVSGLSALLRSRAQIPATLAAGWRLLRASYSSASGHAASSDVIGHKAQ